MNRESIELRIDELNVRKKVLLMKYKDLKNEITKVEGRIEEMWDQLEAWQDKGGYGHRSVEGDVRVMKVPKFKTMDEMQSALEGKPAAKGGFDEKTTLRAREARARFDAQQAVDVLDGNSPYNEDEDASNREADTE